MVNIVDEANKIMEDECEKEDFQIGDHEELYSEAHNAIEKAAHKHDIKISQIDEDDIETLKQEITKKFLGIE